MNLTYILRSNFKNYTDTEKNIALYMLDNLKQIPLLNIFELAENINVSASSITRFVKKYFNLTFPSMKVYLAKEITQNNFNQISEVLSWADNLSALPEKLISEINKAFLDLLSGNEIETIRKAIHVINKSQCVYILGVGASNIYAIELQQKLLKIGIKAAYHLDSNLNMLNTINASSNDVIIAFSYSGRTKEINNAIRESKKRKPKVISITSSLDSALAELSDIVINIPSFENNELRLSSIFSRYENFLIIDCIFIELAKIRISNPKNFSDKYKFMIEGLKEE